MKTNPTNPLPSLTGILIQDPEDDGFTAYFAEFPEAVAEGNTEEEAKKNLIEALRIMLEVKRSELNESLDHLGKVSSFEYNLAS